MKTSLKVTITLAIVIVAFAVGALFTLPSFASMSVRTPHSIVNTTPRIIPLAYQHNVTLVFGPDHWSQQVWVPANFGLSYICDGASRNDALAVMDEYTLPNGQPAWDLAIPHMHIICDNQWHGVGINFNHPHIIVVGETRPTSVIVRR